MEKDIFSWRFKIWWEGKLLSNLMEIKKNIITFLGKTKTYSFLDRNFMVWNFIYKFRTIDSEPNDNHSCWLLKVLQNDNVTIAKKRSNVTMILEKNDIQNAKHTTKVIKYKGNSNTLQIICLLLSNWQFQHCEALVPIKKCSSLNELPFETKIRSSLYLCSYNSWIWMDL